jgi:hypothetical protein
LWNYLTNLVGVGLSERNLPGDSWRGRATQRQISSQLVKIIALHLVPPSHSPSKSIQKLGKNGPQGTFPYPASRRSPKTISSEPMQFGRQGYS